MSEPQLLTTRQVGAILGVHPATVTRWLVSRRLRGFRLPSGYWRVDRKSITRMQESHHVEDQSLFEKFDSGNLDIDD